jgi:pimeloyl-ACP methyl ester carboxylesterase
MFIGSRLGIGGRVWFALTVAMTVIGGHAGAAETILAVPTGRPGVDESLLVIDPPQPGDIAVLLFVGSGGQLDLAGHPPGWRGGNFLFRSADLFVAQGIAAAVLDAPADRSALWRFRTGQEHASDIAAAIAALRGRGARQVWLVGTSMGTLSAANAAARLKQGGPDGVVLTSAVTESSRQSFENVLSVPLEEITVPVLVVRHRDDGCLVSSPAGADRVLARLERAPVRRLLEFAGGAPARSSPCEAFSAHGYLGIEDQVIAAIAAWIRQPQ